jgi:hypothetical protein
MLGECRPVHPTFGVIPGPTSSSEVGRKMSIDRCVIFPNTDAETTVEIIRFSRVPVGKRHRFSTGPRKSTLGGSILEDLFEPVAAKCVEERSGRCPVQHK